MLLVLFQRHGRAARAVGTVAEALRLCIEECFDVLICDIGLPDVDGWELLGLIRLRQAIKAIALSAFTAPADLAHSRAAGFDAHLGKPLDFKLLAAAMTQLVE
jgi:CheY-like chemotaxis protein